MGSGQVGDEDGGNRDGGQIIYNSKLSALLLHVPSPSAFL